MGIGPAEDVAGVLDDHALHAEADPEGGDIMLARVAQSDELALHAARTEAWGDDDTVETLQQLGHVLGRHLLAVDGDQA